MQRKIIEKLSAWKNSAQRKPLLLYGARQVGKTFALQEFAQKEYTNFLYLNLEANPALADFFQNELDPLRVLRFLETLTKESIAPATTLIIFDEIQSCERALTALKYFYEEAPEYHIVAAGSLLGVALNRNTASFPVGKVDIFTLCPMDFEEFLWACGEKRLAQDIRLHYNSLLQTATDAQNAVSTEDIAAESAPATTAAPLAFPEALHQKAIELYRSYLIVGGMPACVQAFSSSNSFLAVNELQHNIMTSYVADMAKYASPSDTVKIRACYQSLPAQLAKENKKFQYKIVQKGGTASLFGASIDWLEQAGLVLKCTRVEQGAVPLPPYADLSAFKLYMGDIGLLCHSAAVPHSVILTGEANPFMGAVTENYIAQCLNANGHSLYYWTSQYSAELNYVLQKNDKIFAIEVKKGVKTTAKSLRVFMEKYRPFMAIRFSEKNFGSENSTGIPLVSLPHYAAFCM